MYKVKTKVEISICGINKENIPKQFRPCGGQLYFGNPFDLINQLKQEKYIYKSKTENKIKSHSIQRYLFNFVNFFLDKK